MSGTLFNPMKSGLRKRLQGIFMHLLSKIKYFEIATSLTLLAMTGKIEIFSNLPEKQ
jgi:hypothetical protein